MREKDQLYHLLPELIRNRDQNSGQALQALMKVLEIEYRRLHLSQERLYEDWFIETCQDWLIPFLGNLVGVEGLGGGAGSAATGKIPVRPLVGKALARRRYKGTLASLEDAVRDATGWGTHINPSQTRLGWSQDLEAVRAGEGGFADLRRMKTARPGGGPFDLLPRTVDLRWRPSDGSLRLAFGGGSLPALPVVDVFCWRLQVFPVWRGEPFRAGEGRYTFDPFGQDVPLFIDPEDLPEAGESAEPYELPLPLALADLRLMLDRLRRRERPGQGGRTLARRWLQLYDRRQRQVVPLESVAAWDLGSWRRPGPTDTYLAGDGQERPFLAAVDPHRGRVTLAEDLGDDLLVSYSYALVADVGGGPYHRKRRHEPKKAWRALVVTGETAKSQDYLGPPVFTDLESALEAWPEDRPHAHLRLLGSGLLSSEDICRLDLSDRSSLRIEASEGARPFLRADLQVIGRTGPRTEAARHADWPQMQIAGLWLDGTLEVEGGLRIEIDNCTLGPPLARPPEGSAGRLRPTGAVRVTGPTSLVGLVVRRSILGPLRLSPSGASLWIEDSVIDGALWSDDAGTALTGAKPGESGPPTKMRRCTVLGGVEVASLNAKDVYFTRVVEVTGPNAERLRHCLLPRTDDSGTEESGDRLHCLPPPPPRPCCRAPGWQGAEAPEGWLTSYVYGDPGYCQISDKAPGRLLTGGTEGSAIGVTHQLFEADRLARLPSIFEHYLRWGMRAQLHLVDSRVELGPPDAEEPR